MKSGPFQISTTSRVQQQPRQKQRVNQSNPDTPKRQFTKVNMPLSQALQHMLRMNLVTLIGPPPNPKTSSPNYNPNASVHITPTVPVMTLTTVGL